MFGFSKKEDNQKIPAPGEVWRFHKRDSSPWPVEQDPNTHSVTILDVKEGWVRFDWDPPHTIWKDQRMPISIFVRCYNFESTTDWEILKKD